MAFSDGIFAIAMTLLVVTITLPVINDADSVRELADALNDQTESYISFFISFAVIGRYWFAHHQFVGQLARLDNGLLGINLVYLAFIAFLPFPTDLLGNYFSNPLSITIYAVSVAVISGLEVVMLRHAHRSGLMRRKMPKPIYRWSVRASTTPVVFFLASVPVAFLSTTVAVGVWILQVPVQAFLDRGKPEGFDEFFAHSLDEDRA